MKVNKKVKAVLLIISMVTLSFYVSFYILKELPGSDDSVRTISLWDVEIKDLFFDYEWEGREMCMLNHSFNYEFGDIDDWTKAMYLNEELLEQEAKKFKDIGSEFKKGDYSHIAYSKSNINVARDFNHILDDFNMLKVFVLLYPEKEQDRVVTNSTLFKKNGRSTPLSNYIHNQIRNKKNDQLGSIRIKVFVIVFLSLLISILISYKLFLKESSE